MNKRETHIVTGMTRDLATSRFEPSYVYDARNIRIRTVGDDCTMLSVTNEKGTSEFPFTNETVSILGTIVGTASFSYTLVLFTKDFDTGYEYIYRIDFNDDYTAATYSTLFAGATPSVLNFQKDNPLETLALYENENIQKVYWVDGVNQPRVINICNGLQTNPDVFNFNREIGTDAVMEVVKYNSGGEFRPGTVQYCFNYFNKFGQETNIVDVSPLYYISPKDSGLAADDISGCSFQITLSNLNTNFEYVRLYAIYRSSENATPSVRIVGDYRINSVLRATRDNQAPTTSVSVDDLYWVSEDLSERQLMSEYYTGPWNGIGPTQIDINKGYVYDASTNKYYSLYYLNTDPILRVDGIVLQKIDENTYIIPDNGVPYYLRTALLEATFRESVGITVVDTGVYGETLDASALLFLGGQYIVAETLAEKDNTLFLGNLRNVVPNIGDIKVISGSDTIKLKDINDHIGQGGLADVESCAFGFNGNLLESFEPENEITDPTSYDIITYDKDNNRSSSSVKNFKTRENYRLGFIGQYKTGQWSEVIWLGDFTEEEMTGVNHFFNPSGYQYDGDTYNLSLWGQQFRGAGFSAEINSSVVDALIDNDFIKVAPVVVYPKFADRYVICQGLLCPTVFNISDRVENAPFIQCDWRFRKGYSWGRIAEEIQLNATQSLPENPTLNTYAPNVPFAKCKTADDNSYVNMASGAFRKYFGTEYYRDPNILTFHSPDIDSSEELYTEDVDSLRLRLVGFSNGGFYTEPLTIMAPYVFKTKEQERKSIIHYFTQLETFGFGNRSELLIPDNTKITPSVYFEYHMPLNTYEYVEKFGGPLRINGFKDRSILLQGETENDSTPYYSWFTYLWHRNGSLNGQYDATNVDYDNRDNPTRVATYKRKCISEKTYGYTTYFLSPTASNTKPTTIEAPTTNIKLYESDSQILFEDAQYKDDVLYYGTSDKILTPTIIDASGLSFYDATEEVSDAHTGKRNIGYGYPVRTAGYYAPESDTDYITGSIVAYDVARSGIDPVQIRYNTTRHAVLSLGNKGDSVIPQLGTTDVSSAYVFWLDETRNFAGIGMSDSFYTVNESEDISSSFLENCMYIGELYRDMSEEQRSARFGGRSQEALTANVWTLAGDAVKLVSGENATLLYKEGDTYFGRYDCLKSYPATQEDKQSIVSIYSTEIESRVNLDLRYGNTMNLDDNTMVTPQNFNLYNHSGYEQTNQYFTYRAIDYDRYLDQHFPNMITWSLEKTLGEDVDKWTSIPLTSTLDLDGTRGEVTKLVRFNNEVFAFQDTAFAQVLFNSRVQIPVSDGQPIEITNGYKVDGKRYISENIGMTNKWSLGVTPYALYFIDDHKNSMYAYNGQLTDISVSKGMKTWLHTDENARKPKWNPVDYGNVRTFYDKIYGELYFTTKDETLVYSEPLGNFTSFMDYGGLESMNNIGNKFFALPDSSKASRLWDMWGGKYNTFFGEFKPFYMTFIANADPMNDKVFNNLEWRSVSYDEDGCYLPYATFDKLRVWHEHQDTGIVELKDDFGMPSVLKKKFNAFRTFVPRDMKGVWAPPGMDRIRNPWAYIKLGRCTENTDQTIFTDLNIDFFE